MSDANAVFADNCKIPSADFDVFLISKLVHI